MMSDDRVKQALTRLYSATTLPLAFSLPGKKSEECEKDPVCVALNEDWWKIFPEGTMREIVAWLGLCSLCLLHVDGWDIDTSSGRVIPKISVWSLRNIRNDPERGWLVRVSRGGWSNEEVPLDLESGEWALLCNGSSWRVVASASWAGIAPMWLLKAYACVDWAASSERHGQGTVVLYNENEEILYDDKARDNLVKMIWDGGRGKVVALPDGIKANLLLDTANTWTTFKAQTDAANAAISISIVGTNLTTEVKEGSRAAATVHADVDTTTFRGMLAGISTGAHDTVGSSWVSYNFGANAVVPYAEWDTTPPEDLKALAETQVQASTAALNWQKAGFNLSRKAIASKWGLVEAENDEDTLVPVAPEPPAIPGQTAPKPTKKASGMLAMGKTETAFSRGRAYVDELESSCCEHAAKAFSPLVAATIAAVEESTGFTDLQDKLRVIYKEELPPSKLMKITEGALIMAQMAGRETVEQELSTEE
jgi:hypothetical protein